MVVTVTLTRRDYATALKAFASPKASLAKRILSLISIALLAYALYSMNATSGNWLYGLAFVVPFVALVAVFFQYAVPAWVARSFVKKNPDKLGPIRHEIGPDGTSYQSVHGDGRLAWTAFHRIRETPDFFLLYTQSNLAQIMPKRCFENKEDISRYREIVRQYYKGKMDLLK